MKRVVLSLGIVFSFVVMFPGCAVEETFKDEAELTSMTGLLHEQTVEDVDFKGTHMLVQDPGNGDPDVQDGIPLRSLSLNLSSSNYLDNEVQVIGFFNEEDDVFEVTGISVITALHELEKDPEFVDYKNTDFGIQLKYYDNWLADESDSLISFAVPSDEEGASSDIIEITQAPFEHEPQLDEDGNEISALFIYAEHSLGMDDPISNLSKIGIDTLDAIKEVDGEHVTYHIYRSGLLYQFTFVPSESSDSENKRIFNEMLAEFKFTGFTVDEGTSDTDPEDSGNEDPSGASDLEIPPLDITFATFESLPFSFGGQYPASWYYSGTGSTDSDILGHYGFSDESVTEDNELISLDIISSEIPSGLIMNESGLELTIVESGKTYTVYTVVDGRNYRLSGDQEYADLILNMASKLVPVVEDE